MNLPNKLSLFRIFLVPVITIAYLLPSQFFGSFTFLNHVVSNRDLIVLLIFIVASITDLIDGYVARKYELITSFGKFIDPIADKLLVNTMLILLAFNMKIPVVAMLIMVWRDILVDGMRMMAAKKGIVVAAHFSGKVKTTLQMIGIILVLLNIYGAEIIIWIAVLASLYSGYEYFKATKDLIMESK